MIRLINLKDHRIISDKCIIAESYFSRLRGWIGKTRADVGEGIFFPRCSSIHMWCMSIPIDVVFLNERNVVTSVRAGARPWKFLPITDLQASGTLELPVGSIERLGILVGDELCFG
ncbi:MAG: DUF192 domain-containing protein [Cryobacterium sp.]|nr:DUF192 domain-containing protein [Oligoflexia bacterium]